MSNYHNATAEIVFCSVDSFRYICAVDAFGGIFYQLTCFGFISTSKPPGSTWETGNKQTYLHTCNHDIPYETENWTRDSSARTFVTHITHTSVQEDVVHCQLLQPRVKDLLSV